MEQKDVFISYKTEEFDDANWVKSTLENNGISCWMAPMNIPGGSSYAVEIPQAIRACKVFVLILSENAQKSKWVPRELDQAINENKTVMPFMLENCALKDDFNFYLTNVQRYAAYKSRIRAMDKMIREIREVLARDDADGSAFWDKVGEAEPCEERSVEAATPEQNKSGGKEKRRKTGGTKAKPAKKRKLPLILGIAAFLFVLAVLLPALTKPAEISIAGKKYAGDAGRISITDAQLSETDIKQLERFPKLTGLTLKNCRIACDNLEPIARPTLTSLSLADCQLTKQQLVSIDYAMMTALRVLDVSGNPGLDTLELFSEAADTLTDLTVSNTPVSDLSPLSGYARLQKLYADNIATNDISALKNCTQLQRVSLNGNCITSLAPLSGCTKLTSVCVNGNALTTLSGLEFCIELAEIQAGSNQIVSLDGLQNATQLWFVFLNDNQIRDISALQKSAARLERVYLRNNQISDISALESCTKLQYLNIDNNTVTSLDVLKNCTELVGLSAKYNEVSSLSGIQNMISLTYGNLAGNRCRLGDADALSFSAEGKIVLDLSENVSVHGIQAGSEFRYLNLHNVSIDNYNDLYALRGNDMLILDYDKQIDFGSLAKTGFSRYRIVDCPLDQQVAVREILGTWKIVFITAAECDGLIDGYMSDGIKGVPEYYQ